MSQLLVNAIMTPDGTYLESRHRHHFSSHTDTTNGKFYAVDGGLDYQRIVGDGPYHDYSVYVGDSHDVIRHAFSWKSYGPNGEFYPEGKIDSVANLTTDHIEAILQTQSHLPDFIRNVFIDEIEYRKIH